MKPFKTLVWTTVAIFARIYERYNILQQNNHRKLEAEIGNIEKTLKTILENNTFQEG